jgi:hypothetical protein
MEDPTHAQPIVAALLKGGMKQTQIVRELRKRGLRVTQPTISRIKKGARTNFKLGMGLLQIHQARQSGISRAATT